MARKRERVELTEAQQLFKQRLETLLGRGPRPRNPALDTLVGAPSDAPEAAEPSAPSEQPAPPPTEATAAPEVDARPPQSRDKRPAPQRHIRLERAHQYKKVGGGNVRVGRTVYLTQDDLAEIDALAAEWSALTHRYVSRSEVLRQAVRWLRGAPISLPFAEGE